MFTTLNPPRRWGLASHRKGIAQSVIHREITGCKLSNQNPFGSPCPDRLRMSMEQIIPQYALEAGNVFMGFTECGRYLMSYTARPSENFGISWGELTFIYRLHFWLFCPYKPVRKVTSILLFDNNGVCDNNLLIEISQWKNDDQRVLITGHSANPDGDPLHTQFFATIATIPPTQHCSDCRYVPDEEQDEDGGDCFNILQPCLQHGLAMHLTFDHVSPFPKFNANVQLRCQNSVVFNTGNVIHALSYKFLKPSANINNVGTTAASPRNDIAPLLQPVTSVPFLRCDFWFKAAISMGTILSKGPIRDDTKYENDRSRRAIDPLDEEVNIFAMKTQESFLSSVIACHKEEEARLEALATSASLISRRLSQFSQDSCSDISVVNSPNPPKSPSGSSAPEKTVPQESNLLNKSPLKIKDSPHKMLPPQERKFFKRRISTPTSPSTSVSPNKPEVVPRKSESSPTGKSPTAYDVFDIAGEESMPDRSFSSFRKRRLADKKYEFSEADLSTENIIPLKLCRKRKTLSRGNATGGSLSGNPNPLGSPRSPRYTEVAGSESPRHLYDLGHPRSPRGISYVMSPVMSPNSELEVLRPLNNNLNNNLNSTVKPPSFSPKDESDMDLEKFLCEYYCNEHSRSRSSTPKRSIPVTTTTTAEDKARNVFSKPALSATVNCIAKVLRSYIQKDDDNVSVITDIEDDYSLGQPFPVAMPLDVHGMAYQQLNMISNAKAEKSPVPVVQVLQRTLDIEVLCNEIAGIICHSADKYYWSFCDYDAAIVHVCPEKGTITAVVYVLVQAANLKGPGRVIDRPMTPQGCQDVPKKYEAVFSFAWEPSQEHCRILYTGDLRELSTVKDPWHPTKHIGKLVKTFCHDQIKVLSNSLAVHDFLSLEELTDSMGIITIYFKEDSQKTDRRVFSSSTTTTSGLSTQNRLIAAASTSEDSSSSSSSSSSDDED